jgi:peptide/nickel transport system ATP-binding protein
MVDTITHSIMQAGQSDRTDTTFLFVAHDLSVVRHVADRVAVMYVGKIIELADTDDLFATPRHPYTEALMSAVPLPDPTLPDTTIILPGEIASPESPPSGCYFHPRCRYATEICRTHQPALKLVSPRHWAACHHSDDLTLRGAAEQTV